MKRIYTIQVLVAFALMLAAAVALARFIDRNAPVALDLTRSEITSLKPQTREFLEKLKGQVLLTYYVSARERMPSKLKNVEHDVRSLLEALRESAPERIDVRVLDPDLDPEHGPAYAAGTGRRVAPIGVRKVLKDESGEEQIWSTLIVSYDAYPDAMINLIDTADLPHLESLVVEHLRAMNSPPRPTVALAAPAMRYNAFEAALSQQARVTRVDLENSSTIPRDADLLFWVSPGAINERHASQLQAFLASGRSVVLAGSAYDLEYDFSAAGNPADSANPVDFGERYRAAPSPCDFGLLLRPFGLKFETRLMADLTSASLAVSDARGVTRDLASPYHVRIPPSNFDMKSFLGPNSGMLVLPSASVIAVDRKRLLQSGFAAEIVATSSERGGKLDFPPGWFPAGEVERSDRVPKQPLAMLLKPDDNWRGQLLLIGSAAMFRDGVFNAPGNANAVFTKTLVRTYTAPARLARIRVPRPEPEQIGVLSGGQRAFWRIVGIVLVPAVLLGIGLRAQMRSRSRAKTAIGRRRRSLLRAAGAAVLLLAATQVLRGCALFVNPYADLSEGNAHTPSELTEDLLAPHRDKLDVELIMSDRALMPPALKQVEREARATLRELRLSHSIVRPEDLDDADRAKLAADGIHPFEVTSVQNDVETDVKVYGAMRLKLGERVETIPRLDDRAVGRLEFLLASAAKRFETRQGPLIGVLSDLPRLSPAEAHDRFQSKGYTAPIGSDVYSQVKAMLREHGYRVHYIDPKTPAFPPDMAALVWLQPRNWNDAIGPISEYLSRGGRAIVALQHYNVTQRQFSGTGYKTVYWPRPQFHRFNDVLAFLGVRQTGDKFGETPGEVLMDRTHGSLKLETEIHNRGGGPDVQLEMQEVSKPFLIRAVGPGLAQDSVITSRLGELAFIWGNRFELDPAALGARGLNAQPLVRTSGKTWTYGWAGGFIPDEAFIEPEQFLPGPQTLALYLRGDFPVIAYEQQEGEGAGKKLMVKETPAGAGAAKGEMMLVGCSEMFKNDYLLAPGYQHDQFLLNAVAYMTQGEDMAEIMARRPVVPSFAHQPTEAKLWWRVVAVGFAPALFVLGALSWSVLRGRPAMRR